MLDRWPPTLGIIGFDQGTKSAVALALLPGPVTTEGEGVNSGRVGACCYVDGTCIIQSQASCAGQYQGDGVPCNPCCSCIQITFSGISMLCPCTPFFPGSGYYRDFNWDGSVIEFTLTGFAIGPPDCLYKCDWLGLTDLSIFPTAPHVTFFNNCTGGGTDAQLTVHVKVTSANVWEILVLGPSDINPRASLFFYGTATGDLDLGPITFSNTISTCGTITSFNEPILQCLTASGPITVDVFGTGGSATLTKSTHCGACCSGSHHCNITTPTGCALYASSVYQGDNIGCTPNPC